MFQVACSCGRFTQNILPFRQHGDDGGLQSLSLCHCNTCRHSTGLLCTSYYPIAAPKSTKGLTRYTSSNAVARYFCTDCGCHVFRLTARGEDEVRWEVATGAVAGATGEPELVGCYTSHHHVAETIDGGASIWLPDCDGKPLKVTSDKQAHATTELTAVDVGDEDSLPASCSCGNVRFDISRPNSHSYLPRSPFPDCTHAYHSVDASNPTDEKWWIRGDGTKYLAGTCACASCRLASGFEIQTWAFVPRKNIIFHNPQSYGMTEKVHLDFATLPNGLLSTYQSSNGVKREFCGSCGATVFWHDVFRPDIVDVSVGLLRGKDGARAESWLEWWVERVSFAEEAKVKRSGSPAEVASKLIQALQRGLKASRRAKP